jgi:hypothetical protein
MARGVSGRIVLEIDVSAKEELYAAVTADGMTLKDWFLQKADEYLQKRNQPELFPQILNESPPSYGGKTNKAGKKKQSTHRKEKDAT